MQRKRAKTIGLAETPPRRQAVRDADWCSCTASSMTSTELEATHAEDGIFAWSFTNLGVLALAAVP